MKENKYGIKPEDFVADTVNNFPILKKYATIKGIGVKFDCLKIKEDLGLDLANKLLSVDSICQVLGKLEEKGENIYDIPEN